MAYSDADLHAFFDLGAASFEVDAYFTPFEPSPVAFPDLFGDGEQETEAFTSDCEDLPQSYISGFKSRIPPSVECTPAPDWASLSLGISSFLGDAPALSINPSLLIQVPETPEHNPHEEPVPEPCIAHSPPHIGVSVHPSPSPLSPINSISLDTYVANVSSYGSPESSAEAVTMSPRQGNVALKRSRPRTRQYMRAVQQSSGRNPSLDLEYLGSDAEESDGTEVDIPSAPPSKRRRKGDMSSRPDRRLRCEEAFCNRSFTRLADLRRHITTLHKQLSREEVLKERREKYRLWCTRCGTILGRVDARRRHESHGSCQRSQAIMEARIRNGTVHGRARRGQLK
ncbi:hypothetical protein BDN67DRAFT_1068446 [Paxillus ammoniavirescens]|nr:hypothetical protein BDN67DRAFT_1068446 [Paxillus ammoniavirescens]